MPDSPPHDAPRPALAVLPGEREVVLGESRQVLDRAPEVLRVLVDSPPHDLAAADALLLRIGRLHAAAEPLLRSVETATGLRRLAIFTLQAISAGHGHPRAIGRQVGADTAVVQSTLAQLCDDGYVQPAPSRPGDRHVELTDAGRAVLEHVEARTLRSTDAVLQLLGPERAREVDRALELLVEALTVPLTAQAETVPGAPIALPAGQPRAIEG